MSTLNVYEQFYSCFYFGSKANNYISICSLQTDTNITMSNLYPRLEMHLRSLMVVPAQYMYKIKNRCKFIVYSGFYYECLLRMYSNYFTSSKSAS